MWRLLINDSMACILFHTRVIFAQCTTFPHTAVVLGLLWLWSRAHCRVLYECNGLDSITITQRLSSLLLTALNNELFVARFLSNLLSRLFVNAPKCSLSIASDPLTCFLRAAMLLAWRWSRFGLHEKRTFYFCERIERSFRITVGVAFVECVDTIVVAIGLSKLLSTCCKDEPFCNT